MKQSFGVQKKMRKKTLELLKHIDAIMSEYSVRDMQITVRQLYYQCVSRAIIPNSKDTYDKISDLIARGRLAGLLDWNVIEDRTRFIRSNPHWNSPQEIISAAATQYRIDTRKTQPFYLEAWIEKDSLVSILELTCSRLDVPCFSCRGFPSVTSLHEAAERFRDKPNPIILYAGDHDPSGLKIPKVIHEQLSTFGVHVELRRIGLTIEQIRKLNVPPFPAKEKDANYREYVETTGLTQAWELDALPPDRLAAIFEHAVHKFTDHAELERMIELENRDKTVLSKLTKEGEGHV